MKRTFLSLVAIFFIAIIFTSCSKEEDVSLLVGRWQSGTVWERYDADGNGRTWDTADDVSEDEAQRFTWTLVESDLTQIHIMEIGPGVPKYYTVVELTSTTLKYVDSFDVTHTFTKVTK